MKREDFLNGDKVVQHIDITSFDATGIIDQFDKMAFQARNLARAAKIYNAMLKDRNCSIILCLAGSLVSAGLKRVFVDLVRNNMIDAVVSTGANIVDQDFFEGLGFRHYQGTPEAGDKNLQELNIDRIYDTYIDEEQLRVCDQTIADIANALTPRAYSSREFIREMGKYLVDNKKGEDCLVRTCYEKGVPIFVPAFSDCSAGFGLVHHQYERGAGEKVSIDSAKDFLELTKIKVKAGETGLLMIGGGVPKNFAQDIVVAAEFIDNKVDMHKYAVQITVADVRDGALSGSTLQEAHSWGKVEMEQEQMVFAEATMVFPLLASYAYHRGCWRAREEKRFNSFLD